MLLGFKSQFVPFILDGSKTHTIRAQRKVQPKRGETCHCYTNVRQKNMKLLGRWPLVRVEEIALDFEKVGIGYRLRVKLDGLFLNFDEAEAFAWADGFRAGRYSLDQMARFLIAYKRLEDAIDSPAWTGHVYHWDFERPVR